MSQSVSEYPIPDQAPACLLPDMLVVATEGLVDVEQEGKVFGLLQVGLLAGTLKQLRVLVFNFILFISKNIC